MAYAEEPYDETIPRVEIGQVDSSQEEGNLRLLDGSSSDSGEPFAEFESAASDKGAANHDAAFAEEVIDASSVYYRNDEGEFAYTPEGVLTLEDLPAEPVTLAARSALKVSVTELGGVDRCATVAKEALYAFDSCDTAVVASGLGYADSIAAAGSARSLDCPILLTNYDYVPDVTVDALKSLGVKRVVLLGSEVSPTRLPCASFRRSWDLAARSSVSPAQIVMLRRWRFTSTERKRASGRGYRHHICCNGVCRCPFHLASELFTQGACDFLRWERLLPS